MTKVNNSYQNAAKVPYFYGFKCYCMKIIFGKKFRGPKLRHSDFLGFCASVEILPKNLKKSDSDLWRSDKLRNPPKPKFFEFRVSLWSK